MRHLNALLVLTVSLICHGAVRAADGPTSVIPELTVLKHYLGNWNVTYSSETAPFTEGRTSAEWTLDGRFLKQTSELKTRFTQPHELSVTSLITYDRKARVYRSWTFVSNGRTSRASGKWDAETNTMTWTSSPVDGITSTRAETFAKDGTQSWTTDSMNAQNKAVGHSEGTSTRIDD